MAIQQPPYTGDEELDSFTAELARQINNEQLGGGGTSNVEVDTDDEGRPVIGGILQSYQHRYLHVRYATDETGSTGFTDDFTTISGLTVYQGLRNDPSTTESTTPSDYTWREITVATGWMPSFRVLGGRLIDWMFGLTVAEGYELDDAGTIIDLENFSGATGAAGNSTGSVFVYIRSNTVPSAPNNVTDYNSANGNYTAPPGWSKTVAGTSGTNTLYFASGAFFGTGVLTIAFSGAQQLNGSSGTRIANGFVYKADTTAGDAPTGGTFNFTTGVLTPPTGYSLTEPSSTTAGQQIFVSYWVATEATLGGTVTITYSTPTLGQIVVNDVKSINYDGSTNLTDSSTLANIGDNGYFLDGSSGIFALHDIIARDFDVSGTNVRLGRMSGNPGTITGTANISIGEMAGMGLTTGFSNISIGNETGQAITEGNFNTHVGAGAGFTNTTGGSNVSLGAGAGGSVSTGNGNTFIGTLTGSRIGGTGDITGVDNIGIGMGAFGQLENGTAFSGNFNVGIGVDAGSNMTTGINNILLGRQSGANITEGTDNTLLGHLSGTLITTGVANISVGSTNVFLANSVSAIAIGNALSPTSGQILIGNDTQNDVRVGSYVLADLQTSSNLIFTESVESNVETRTLTSYRNADRTVSTVTNAEITGNQFKLELLSFLPTFGAVTYTPATPINWDVAVGDSAGITVSVNNPSNFTTRYINSVSDITISGASVLDRLRPQAQSVTPAGGVDWTQAFLNSDSVAHTFIGTTPSGVSSGDTTNDTTGGSVAGTITYADDADVDWSVTSSFNYQWNNIGFTLTAAALPNTFDFLKTHASTTFSSSVTGVSSTFTGTGTYLAIGGTVAGGADARTNHRGVTNEVFTFTNPIHKNSSSADLSSVFTGVRPVAVTGVSYTSRILRTVDIDVPSFRYPTLRLFTANSATAPTLADIVSGSDYAEGVTVISPTGALTNGYYLSELIVPSPAVASTIWVGLRAADSPANGLVFSVGNPEATTTIVTPVATAIINLFPTPLPTGYQAETYAFAAFNVSNAGIFLNVAPA